MNEHGWAPIQLYLWMLKFEFYIIFTCHETIVFSDLLSTVLKSLLGADIFVTPLSRQGAQTWGEASSWAGSSLEQLNPGQARAVETCTVLRLERTDSCQGRWTNGGATRPRSGSWREGDVVRFFGEQVGCTPVEVQEASELLEDCFQNNLGEHVVWLG